MKRQANPRLSSAGTCALAQYERTMRSQEDPPCAAVKLVGEEESAPRHLDHQEEQALVAAVTKAGTLRDRVLIVLLLHTGLRAREVCRLYRMAESVPLHRLAQIMGHDSLDTTKLYIQGTKHDLQRAVETIAWT